MTQYHIKPNPYLPDNDRWDLFRDGYLIAHNLSKANAKFLFGLCQKSAPVRVTDEHKHHGRFIELSFEYECPSCTKVISRFDTFCSSCGQKLEWSLESEIKFLEEYKARFD